MFSVLSFKKMLSPILIKIIFAISLVLCLTGGIYQIFGSLPSKQVVRGLWGESIVQRDFNIILFLSGLFTLIIVPLLLRILCEIMIVVFNINENTYMLRMYQESNVQQRTEQ